ncbi:MAG: hypothetical protein ACE14T_10850 [Syntrophales bacterium]
MPKEKKVKKIKPAEKSPESQQTMEWDRQLNPEEHRLEQFFEDNEVGMDHLWYWREDFQDDLDYFNLMGWYEIFHAIPEIHVPEAVAVLPAQRAKTFKPDEGYASLITLYRNRGTFRYALPAEEEASEGELHYIADNLGEIGILPR